MCFKLDKLDILILLVHVLRSKGTWPVLEVSMANLKHQGHRLGLLVLSGLLQCIGHESAFENKPDISLSSN